MFIESRAIDGRGQAMCSLFLVLTWVASRISEWHSVSMLG